MYADDQQLFSVAKSSNEAERILTREGNNISEWYNKKSTRKLFKVSGDESGSEELPKGSTYRYWRR